MSFTLWVCKSDKKSDSKKLLSPFAKIGRCLGCTPAEPYSPEPIKSKISIAELSENCK